MEHSWIIEVVGLVSQVLFIGSFFLLQMDKIEEEGALYNIMNLVAAILTIFYYGWFYAVAGVIGNMIWASIALYGLYKFVKNRGVVRGKSNESSPQSENN